MSLSSNLKNPTQEPTMDWFGDINDILPTELVLVGQYCAANRD